MKKLFLLVLGVVILAASMVIGASATETGWTFTENELWEVESAFEALPTVYEARLYPTDVSVASVIFGNYCKSWDEGFDLRIGEGGVPTLIINAAQGKNTLTIPFGTAVVNEAEWVDIKVIYDASGKAAYCYLDGELKSTVDLGSKTLPSVTPDSNIVIGGNRVISDVSGAHNQSYFRGYIESVSASVGENVLFSYDYSAESNTEALMKDQSGKGCDAIRSDIWLSSSGIEDSGEEYTYTFAVVGDPQTISQASVKDKYLDMYRWIAEQNPDFVMTLGDIIQSGNSSETPNATAEWAVALEALSYLDAAGIPHSDVKGNHCTRAQFNKYITYDKYSNAFASKGVTTLCYAESMLNCAYLFEVSGVKYMIFSFEYGPSEAVLGWAGRLCEIYYDHNVIVTTHSYLGRDGEPLSVLDSGDAIEGGGYTTGEEDYAAFVDKYPNIVLVISGHISNDNVVVTQRENSCGTLVTEILIDFQDVDGKIPGAVGAVNMFNFTEDGKKVYIETYSTAKGAYYKNINQIKLTLDTAEPKNDYAPSYGTKGSEGEIGDYTYTLYGDKLVISSKGSGTLAGSVPSSVASAVKTIVIENDTAINTIGDSFFEGFASLKTLVIPETLKVLGSKAISGIGGLYTVAYFNDYYSDSFDGEGIIDISKVFHLASDSLEGSGANASAVYLSRYAEISGSAKGLISNASAVYYTYPSGSAAQYMRFLGNAVKHSYYTAEMTGDTNLALSGTSYMNGSKSTTTTLNWSFNLDTKTLSVTQGSCNSLRMHGEGSEFDNWKAVWVDLIEVLSVGSATYSQFESFEGTNSISYGLTNLKSVTFKKQLDLDDRETLTGWFENCTSLISMSGGGSVASDEGIIDLTWWRKIRNENLDRMFKNCTSIKGVIFPKTMAYQNTSLYFRIWKSMFEGCTSLGSITIPSYAVSIEANAFAGCTSLSKITIEATGFTVSDKSAFPDQKMTIYVQSLEDKETITSLGYENIKVVSLYGMSGTMESGYTWGVSEEGQLTIGGTGNGKIEFASVPTAEDYTAIPWYSLLGDITSVVIEESTGITGATAYALSNMPSCETITLSTTFGDFTTDGLFVGNTSLKAITVQGTQATEGVIDLRGATAIKASAFANIPAVIWLGNADGVEVDFTGIDVNDSISFVSYPTCDAADDVREFIRISGSKKVNLSYYSVEFDPTLSRSGAQGTGYTWSFDEVSGILTITGTSASELVINANNTAFLSWKSIWKDAIVKIQVAGSAQWNKMQINNGSESFFNNLPNLEAILFTPKINQWQAGYSYLFANCPMLTTLDFGTSWDTVEYGVIDLSGATNIGDTSCLAYMFSGCSSITSVRFPSSKVASTHIGVNMFKDCTSLVAITLPATITNILSGAFDGCASLRTISLAGETIPSDISGIPDKEGLKILCVSTEMAENLNAAGNWTYTKAVFTTGEFEAPTAMNGFSIRLKNYNGLRSMFSFDTSANELNEAAGYTLVEYGAIAMSEAAYNSVGGPKLTYKNGVYALNAGKKVRVYSANDGFVDDDGNDVFFTTDRDHVNFNVAVVKYTANHASNIYMCAYSVYMSPAGETVITYTHYSDDHKFFNLYDITLEMYKAGAVNASVSDDAAVWNTLLTGAVIVSSGEKYIEIPAVEQSNNGYTHLKNVTITLVIDTDGKNYVAIYRGEGAVPSQWDGYENGNYGGTSMHQLGSSFAGVTPASGYDAVPVLTADEYSAIKTIIMDHGIVAIGRYSFVGLDHPTTYVYPTTLQRVGNGAFLYNAGITTAYMAHVDDPNKVNEIGLVDFSGVPTVDLADGTFRYAANVTKVHLPQNVVNAKNELIFGVSKWYCKMKLTKLWFGDNAEPEAGVVDMSNISITSIGKNAFRSASSITTLILPDGCESIDASAFYGSGGSSEASVVMKNFKTIKQPTYHAAVAEFCATNGLSYVDYQGNELKAPEN